MLQKALVCLILIFSVFGCSNPKVQQLQEWSGPAKEKAKAGQLLWSDYYRELFSKVAELPEMQGKAFYLQGANLLLESALAMEGGKISRQQFEFFQRRMMAAESEYAEKTRAQNAAAWAQAAANYNQFLQAQAMQIQAWQSNRPINCVTQQLGNSLATNCR